MLREFSFKELILDAKKALEAEAYFSAMSLTFAIISACANVEYPDDWFKLNAEHDDYLIKNFPSHYKNGKYIYSNHDKERFQMWVDDWENSHNCEESIKEQMEEYKNAKDNERRSDNGIFPEINGELLYQLRCVFFHEASSEIEFNNPAKIADEGNKKIDPKKFTLTIVKNNSFDLYANNSSSLDSSGAATLDINVNAFICHYLRLAEKYFNKKQEEAKFHTITINDNNFKGD